MAGEVLMKPESIEIPSGPYSYFRLLDNVPANVWHLGQPDFIQAVEKYLKKNSKLRSVTLPTIVFPGYKWPPFFFF